MSALELMTLNSLAFGIRYDNHFRLEDDVGEIIDDVMDADAYGPERFPEIAYSGGIRQLINRDKGGNPYTGSKRHDFREQDA